MCACVCGKFDSEQQTAVLNILGYLGVLQLIGTIFEASGLEVEHIGYTTVNSGL